MTRSCIFCGRRETRRWALETDVDYVGIRYAHCKNPADCWRYGVRRHYLRMVGVIAALSAAITGGAILLSR